MSVGEYYSPIPKGRSQMPAVFFIYDLSPITVTVRLFTLAQKQKLVYLYYVYSISPSLVKHDNRSVPWDDLAETARITTGSERLPAWNWRSDKWPRPNGLHTQVQG